MQRFLTRKRDTLPTHLGDPSGKSKGLRSSMPAMAIVALGLTILGVIAGVTLVLLASPSSSTPSATVNHPSPIMAAPDPVDPNHRDNVKGTHHDDHPDVPVIVLSSGGGLWNTGVWPGWGMGSDVILNWAAAGVEVKKTCPVSCRFSNNQADITKASAVIMELVNHEKFLGKELAAKTPIAWPAKRADNPSLPLVGNFFYEPSQHFSRYTTDDSLRNNVDFTLSPSGDIPIGLTCPWGNQPQQYLAPPPTKTAGRAVAYFNEHGIAEEFQPFVKEFVSLMGDRLHAYGHLKNTEMPDADADKPFHLQDRIDFLGTYKFHLVTEFTVEENWVEGELSQSYLAGSVPIYLGAPNVADHVPGDHSMISVRDFDTPEALAKYVTELLEDEDRYNAYFDWKHQGLAPRFQEHLNQCVHYAECRICQFVHDKLPQFAQ